MRLFPRRNGSKEPEEEAEGAAARLRREMVDRQLRPRGIRDPRVLEAFLEVPRHRFVPASMAPYAYEDHPLSIGQGQTISQPYIVALMTRELQVRGGEKVLEVGTGSGYQAAILAHMGAEVFGVERLPALAERARTLLRELGYDGVRLDVGDGTLGLPREAPFDRIIVTAAAPEIPPSLKDQLADGGLLVIPVGESFSQVLLVIRREGDRFHTRNAGGVVFVKLKGKEGWPA